MKKSLSITVVFVLFVLLFITSCNNIFHNLLPPPNNDIISFAVQFSDGSRSVSSNEIENQTITVTVPDGTDLTNLIPVVTVSEKATVIPGTLPYLNKVFPERDLMHLAVQMNNAFKDGTFKDWFLGLVLDSKKVSIPRLDIPVDFSVPVYFCVISGDGNYKLYTVNVITETEKIIEETGKAPSGADNFILSFEVPGQRGTSEIIHEGIDSSLSGTVDFVVEQGTNIRSLLPAITVSEGAKIIPLTMEYIMNCGFTFDQMLGFYTGYSTATDIEKYVSSFLRRATNIVYPEITTAMDFSSSVPFAVVGSDGGVRVYNANCSVYDGTPKLEKVYFSKVNNPYLLKDFECENSLDSFIGQATYPDEMELDYGLIPDIVFIGEKATYSINGGAETEIVSGVTVIPFTSGNRTCAITVYRDGNTKTYNLTVEKVFDPDTIRSITDYRFKKQKNSGIRNTVIASIYNEGDTGYISATVLYEGNTAPYDLVVDFISPGTVTTADTIQGTVPGTVQSSGVTSNNFQYSRKFLCTSRNGLYTRLYTVNIEFVQVIPAEVAIKNFAFPVYLNGDLSQDAVAIINDADGSIRCQVTYASESVPKNLVAEFSATGAVTCSGITQTSGYTANNFTYSQYYTVTVQDEYYGTLTKNYKVEVVYKKDNDSACELLTFGFATEDNPTLTSDVNATVTQRNGSVYAFMPFGAGATEGNALVPYFTAEGTVTVNGARQTSGASGQDFSSPVTYTVTSANGRYTKDYTVTLQESGAIIYVDCEAYGLNNGTSWQDAYVSLDKALEQAALIPAESAAEIWVTAPEDKTYVSTEETGFKLYKEGSITILGGFDGTEQNASERQFDSNGNLLKRTKIQNYNNGTNGIFECNYLIKDYVYIEGFANTENNCDGFFYSIPTTGAYSTEPSFINSNIVINDCEFYSSYISWCILNSYNIKISNSKTKLIADGLSGNAKKQNTSFIIDNCSFLENTSTTTICNVSCDDIKFNNNTIYGFATIILRASDNIEFENNKQIENSFNEKLWELILFGKSNFVLNDKRLCNVLLSNANAEFNNCEFIYKNSNTCHDNEFTVYSGSKVIVNNSNFDIDLFYSYSDAEVVLNNCNLSLLKRKDWCDHSGFFNKGNLSIYGGNCNFQSNNSTNTLVSNTGTVELNNTEMNFTSSSGASCIVSAGNLSINGGTFNLKSTQGGNSLNAKGSLSINGGTFNFEHAAGFKYPLYVGCDATISDAKFNFTGDEYTPVHCALFTSGTNGSTIKNCEFIIDKCAYGGFYANQAGLKIENSKFNINVYPENSGDTCYGFFGSKDFSIDGGTYDLGTIFFYGDGTIKNSIITASVIHALLLNYYIDSSTMNLEISKSGSVRNLSDNITNTVFNFSGETNGNNVWVNLSSKLTNCNFDFTNINFVTNNIGGAMNLSTSCCLVNCIFNGAVIKQDNKRNKIGAAVYIYSTSESDNSYTFENCTFSNNKILKDFANDNDGGAAIAIEVSDDISCNVLFKNCNFINNFTSWGLASHIWVGGSTSMISSLIFEGTTMSGPKCPVQIFNGGKSYKNEAIYVRYVTVTGTVY